MVDIEYVKKRRRKKIAAIVTITSSVLIIMFIIISFLGRSVGTFTIGLHQNKALLSLSENKDFEKSSTYLRVNEVPSLDEYTIRGDSKLNEDELIDNEETDVYFGSELDGEGNRDRYNFFKHTFYVKNISDYDTTYSFELRILQLKSPYNSAVELDEVLRVKLYENISDDEHDYKIFAKKRYGNNEYVWQDPDYQDEHSLDYALPFEGDKLITSYTKNIEKYQIIRYTVVFWLEGNDPNSKGEYPLGSGIRLGIDIQAHENN
ncbi:MAG: hypothetical protein ACI31G_00065 [Bacilli bacterium]